SAYRVFYAVGHIVAPLIVGLATAVLGLTWRGAFVLLGVVSMACAAAAVRLRDPGFGRWDSGEVRKAVRHDTGADPLLEDETQLGFFAIVRRLLLIPTVRRVLIAEAVFGMFLIPFSTFIFFFFQQRWGMGPGARSLLFASFPLFAIPLLAYIAPRGDALFRKDPGELLRRAAWLLGACVVLVVIAVASPVFGVMVAAFGLAVGAFQTLNPLLAVAMLTVVPPRMRPHGTALIGIAVAAVGGTGGIVLLQGMDARFGLSVAIGSLAIPGLIAALVLRNSARLVEPDLDRMIDEIVEEEKVRELTAAGEKLPMLACRGIDFSY